MLIIIKPSCNFLQFYILPRTTRKTTMYRIITLALLAIFLQSLQGQDKSSSITFDAGYFGESITKPGAIASVQKQISAKNSLHHLRLNIAFYKHSGYNSNLLVFPEYVFRITSQKGRFFEAAAGSGWMYQQPDRPVIQYENGVFSETNRGWHYVAPTILLGGGKRIDKGSLEGMAYMVGMRWFGQYPFNGFLMHHLVLECRVSVPLELFR